MFCNLQYDDDILCIKESEIFRENYVLDIKRDNRPDRKGKILSLKINGLRGFNHDQEKWVKDCLNLQTEILNSREHYNRYLLLDPIQSNDMNMMQLYRLLHSGKSNWDHKEDLDLDYFITLYRGRNSKVLGSTSMKTGKMKLNEIALAKWMREGDKGKAKYIGHSFHEYHHSFGLKHKGWNYKKAITYRAGYDMRDHAYEVLIGKSKLTPLAV